MSRYIDADKLIADLEKWKRNPNNDDSSMDLVNHFQGIIQAEPTADVIPREFHDKTCEAMAKRHQNEIADMVEVVRCKECKKANTEDCSHSYWDDDWGEWRVGYRGDEWFCADGEREGER